MKANDGTPKPGDGTLYGLAKKNGVVGFYKIATTSEVPAWKIYLEISTADAPEFLGFDGGITSINELNVKDQVDGEVFNLAGQRVAQPTKGLYIVSGKTKTFNHSNPLISSRTDASYGYEKLDEGMTKLVFEVKKLSSNMNYSSALTTLTYVNSLGQVATHNYGDLQFPVHENFQWVFDLSTATLTDGCIGLISMTNNNWSSNLQFTFGDVYLTGSSNLYAGTLSGVYVADDSYVLDFSTDPSCTSIDMTAVTGLPATLSWLEGSNRVVYVSGNSELSGTNVVKDGVCASLVIDERFGAFRPAQTFTATEASYTCEVNGQHIIQIPFQATIPEGVNVYTLTEDLTPVAVTTAPANQPLLVEGQGVVTFLGSGEVSYASCPLSDKVLPITTPTTIGCIYTSSPNTQHLTPYYDLNGKRVDANHRGILISNGRKMVTK